MCRPCPTCRPSTQWEQEAERIRATVLERIVYRGEAARWRDAATKVEWLDTIDGGPGYRIRKLRYEALPGLWIPALLYEPENLTGKVPAVLNVNGHTPLGKQYPPKQIRCINQAKRGMLALNVEWVGMGQLAGPGFDHYRMNQLDLCGTSGLAPFYLDMKRGLDVLLEPRTRRSRSRGGDRAVGRRLADDLHQLARYAGHADQSRGRLFEFQDPRVASQGPGRLGADAQRPGHDLRLHASDGHDGPRPTLLTFNLHDDCCFEGAYALEPLLNAAQPIFRLYDKQQSLRSHVNDDPPAKHNYEVDNRQQHYRMLGDFFYPGDEKYDAREIPSDGEVKSEEALRVAMPDENLDFNKLALSLCGNLPRDAVLPNEAAAAIAWQQSRRVRLREIVRAKDYEVRASEAGHEEKGGVKATFWKVRMSNVWTVPAVEFVQGEPQRTAIVVADEGRQSAAAKVAELLGAGYRVIAVDPFYLGESKIAQRDCLFDLQVAAVGDRPIGLQASQVAALARWSAAQRANGPVTLIAVGPRASAMALIAAALEDQAIGSVALHGSLGSLKEVIEQNWGVVEKPELFCFGLLESFDIKQLAALIAPRPVKFVEPGDRAKTELADLAAWYQLWQSDFNPLVADLSP